LTFIPVVTIMVTTGCNNNCYRWKALSNSNTWCFLLWSQAAELELGLEIF